jgi:hypothetical protein
VLPEGEGVPEDDPLEEVLPAPIKTPRDCDSRESVRDTLDECVRMGRKKALS